jgi:hypothetical protein
MSAEDLEFVVAGIDIFCKDKRWSSGTYMAAIDLLSMLQDRDAAAAGSAAAGEMRQQQQSGEAGPQPQSGEAGPQPQSGEAGPQPLEFKLDSSFDPKQLKESGYFMIPNFTERFHGWNDDTDHSSALVAFSAFINHALNCVRIGRIMIYSCASTSEARRKVLHPFIDLALRFKNIAQGLDMTQRNVPEPEEMTGEAGGHPSSAWSRVVSGILDVRAWWKKQILDSTTPATRSSLTPATLKVFRDLNHALRNVYRSGVKEGEGFDEHVWWMVGHLACILLSSSAKMINAAATVSSTHLYEYGGTEDVATPTRNVWKKAWDANMYMLKSTASLYASTCQFEGIGRVDAEHVWMPNFDGSLTKIMDRCYSFIIHIDEEKEKLAANAARAGVEMAQLATSRMQRKKGGRASFNVNDVPIFSSADSPVAFVKVKVAQAYEFSRRGMLFLMIRMADERRRWEMLSAEHIDMLPVVRWDAIVGHSGMPLSRREMTKPIDIANEPSWIGLTIRMRQPVSDEGGAGTGAVLEVEEIKEYAYGGVLFAPHIIELFRPARFAFVDSRNSFKAQVYTVVVNPSTWGHLGSYH